MKRRVIVLSPASQDAVDQAEYYEVNGSLALAARFWRALDSTYDVLRKRPGIGKPSGPPNLRALRIGQFPVKGFRAHIVFYRQIPEGLEIVRILHASRDLKTILETEQ